MVTNRIKRVQWLFKRGAFLAVLLAAPLLALADNAPATHEPVDWRLEGYGSGVSVSLEPSSTSLVWLLLVGLGIICIAVMFKNAKRTHLD